MIIATTPIPNLYNTNTAGQTESINVFDDSLWSRHDVSDHVRLLALQYRLQKVIADNEAADVRTAVSVLDLERGEQLYAYNQTDLHYAASINKLAVALLLLEDLRAGQASLDQPMTWTAADVRGGFGTYDQPGAPLQAPLRDVVYDMLHSSGNTAVRIVVNGVLGGPQAVNERLAAKPQLPHTRLIPLDSNRFFLGNTTSGESLWIMAALMQQPQDAPAQFMSDAMHDNIFTDFGVRSQMTGNDSIVLVNKIGLLDDVEGNNRHDVGIIYNTKRQTAYAYAILTTAPYDETDASATAQANRSVMDMGRPLLRFAGAKQHQTEGSPQAKSFGGTPRQAEQKILY